MKISFPDMVMPKVTAMGTISFQSIVNDEYIWCEISCEVLREHFGAPSMDDDDLIESFYQNKDEILRTTRAYLELNDGCPVLLMTENFN
jgi:hypothetical protein